MNVENKIEVNSNLNLVWAYKNWSNKNLPCIVFRTLKNN